MYNILMNNTYNIIGYLKSIGYEFCIRSESDSNDKTMYIIRTKCVNYIHLHSDYSTWSTADTAFVKLQMKINNYINRQKNIKNILN